MGKRNSLKENFDSGNRRSGELTIKEFSDQAIENTKKKFLEKRKRENKITAIISVAIGLTLCAVCYYILF